MILIHITKESREPKVGEWTEKGQTVDDDQSIIERYYDGGPLSLSVILDAPEKCNNPFWKIYNEPELIHYPISNAEEIFQWLHDNGKLGEEWVEWPYSWDHPFKGGEVELVLPNKQSQQSLNEQKSQNKEKCTCETPLIRGVNPEYCGICEKDLEMKVNFIESWDDIIQDIAEKHNLLIDGRIQEYLEENYEVPKPYKPKI